MYEHIKRGLGKKCEELVSKDKLASVVGSGLLDVYSTPAMIALMEKTASESIEPYLEAGESSVGAEVNIRHLRPTPPGMKVYCNSTVLEIEGRKVTFKVEVFDQRDQIGSGIHVRYIIDKQRFMKKSLDG